MEEVDIPSDVRAVLQELEQEEAEPDEEQLQYLEDVWLKAGEISM